MARKRKKSAMQVRTVRVDEETWQQAQETAAILSEHLREDITVSRLIRDGLRRAYVETRSGAFPDLRASSEEYLEVTLQAEKAPDEETEVTPQDIHEAIMRMRSIRL